MVSNVGGKEVNKIKTKNHWTNRNQAHSSLENAITVQLLTLYGPHLYNPLPKYLSGMRSEKTEKLF